MNPVGRERVQGESLTVRLANLGMILLFPGFLVYHLAMSAFGFPAFIQGLFGPVAAALFLYFVILFFASFARRSARVGFYSVLVIYTIFYFLIWTIVHVALDKEGGNHVAVIQSLETVVFYTALFGVGMFFSFESPFVRKIYIYCFWGVVVALLAYVLATGKSMFYANQIFQSEQGATYQGYGRSMLVVTMIVLALTKKAFWRVVYSFFALLALFVLGARSELFGCVFFVFLLFSVMSAKRYSWAALSFVGLLLLSVVVIFFSEWVLSNRAAQVLDLSSASSWQARVEYMRVALRQIDDSPVLGQFGGHVTYFDSEGSYAHNVLSAWVNYGLLGFLMVLGLTAYAFVCSVRDAFASGLSEPITVASMGFNAVSLLLILVAKSVFWPVVALGWGIYVNSQRAARKDRFCH